jgi:hypothetical protein
VKCAFQQHNEKSKFKNFAVLYMDVYLDIVLFHFSSRFICTFRKGRTDNHSATPPEIIPVAIIVDAVIDSSSNIHPKNTATTGTI